VYAYIPRIIKYYLGEDMILPNVKTYICDEEKIENTLLKTFIIVVKQTDASGGYGMLIGPKSTKRAARIHCKNKTQS
jgi:uncharacterized circularly permuted ATP-grasp superfamily protein